MQPSWLSGTMQGSVEVTNQPFDHIATSSGTSSASRPSGENVSQVKPPSSLATSECKGSDLESHERGFDAHERGLIARRDDHDRAAQPGFA